jgi:hypothetical protein
MHDLMKEGTNKSDILAHLSKLEETLSKLQCKVDKLCTLSEDDSSEIERQKFYFLSMNERFVNMQREVEDYQFDVKPSDSVSQAGSGSLSGSISCRLEAKQAALRVRADALKKSQMLKKKMFEMEQMQESLSVETDLLALEAEMKVYKDQSDSNSVTVRKVTDQINVPVRSQSLPSTPFPNPQAPPFPNPQAPAFPNPQAPAFVNPRDMLHTNPPDGIPTNQVPDRILQTSQTELIQLLQLPRVEIMTFHGDPVKYHAFCQSFDHAVGNTSLNPSTKLNHLLRFCAGRAREVIECCVIMDNNLGYQCARDILEKRFGNKYVISKSWLRKISEFSIVKPGDGKELRSFADIVRTCFVSLGALGSRQSNNHEDNRGKATAIPSK